MASDLPPPTGETPKPRMRTGLRVVLFVSLALNLLVAGLVVGAVASGRAGDKARMDLNFGPFIRALSDEDRRLIVRQVRNDPEARPPSPRERRRDLVEIVDILRTEPFDTERLNMLLAKQRDVGTRVVVAAHTAFAERLAAASPADRAAFADRLEAELRRGPSDRRPPSEGSRDGG